LRTSFTAAPSAPTRYLPTESLRKLQTRGP
jgi:hypothetical protein